MNAANEPRNDHEQRRRAQRVAVGITLILIGAGLALTTWLDLAWVPTWLAGLALLTWGATQHKARLIVVGGIATGVGLAITAQTGPWVAALAGPAQAGLFLLCFALGWFLIIPVTRLAAPRTVWWPALPGTVMAASGAALWVAPDWTHAAFSLAWPILLIAGGLALIIHWNLTK